MYLIGVDVGTTATKAVLADTAGNILACAQTQYALHKKPGGHAVQDAQQWWETLALTVKKCLEHCPDVKQVAALSLSTQGGSLVCADEQGTPLSEALVWLDTRSLSQRERMVRERDEAFFYRKTGWRLSAGLNLCKIAWISENDPALFRKTRVFLSTADYLNMRLTGKAVIDPSNAAMTQLYDIMSNRWDSGLLALCGITEERLPEIRPSGTLVGELTSDSAAALGLPRSVRVFSGGHDQYCAAAGCGALKPGDVMLSAGTAWAVLAVSGEPSFDNGFSLSPGRHVAPGMWGEMATVPAAGVCLEWLCGTLSGAGESLSCIDATASGRREKARELLFYPYLSGSGAPDHNVLARGAFTGLDLSHDRYDMALAVMEGVVFQTRLILERFEACGVNADAVRVLGGAAKSGLWMQLLSCILNRRLIRSGGEHAACTGALLTAGVGCGVFGDFAEGFRHFEREDAEITPDLHSRSFYEEKYRSYVRGVPGIYGFAKHDRSEDTRG